VAIEREMPLAFHNNEQCANNRAGCGRVRLKAWLRFVRGLKRDRIAPIVISGHAFLRNVERGQYELGADNDRRL
jgi:hypothetical protein